MCGMCGIYSFDSITSEEADQRVAKGIEWLNKAVGLFWPRLVDVHVLDINNVRRCVLGQVFTEYAFNNDFPATDERSGILYTSGYDYAYATFSDKVSIIECGFSGLSRDMGALTDAWKRALS